MPIRKLTIVAAGGTWVVRAGGAVIGESAQAVELSRNDGAGTIYFPREDLGMAREGETILKFPSERSR